MRNILISGTDDLLGVYLAAHRLAFTPCDVFYLAHPSSGVTAQEVLDLSGWWTQRPGAGKPACEERDCPAHRLHVIVGDQGELIRDLSQSAAGLSVEEAWCLDTCSDSQSPQDVLEENLHAKLKVEDLNYVCGFGQPGGLGELRSVAESAGKADSVRFRVFRIPYLLAEHWPISGWSKHPLMRLAGALEQLKSEIEERLPDYFDYQSLRCLIPPGTRLNLISAARAVEVMTRITECGLPAGADHIIASRNQLTSPDLLELVGTAYELSLIPASQPEELNAIDSLFHGRLGELNLQTVPAPKAGCLESYRIAGMEPAQAVFDRKSLLDVLMRTRTGQQRVRRAWEERVAGIPARLRQKTISRNGSELTYLTAGEGAPLVIVNALGHGLHYWYRLIEALMPRRRIIIWELRGTFGCPGEFGLRDQVDDLEAILHNEQIDSCHLLGWCTGAKIIIQFCLRNPRSVLSMVCLNGAYPAPEGSEDLEMPYERGLKPLSRLVYDNPSMAPSAMRLLRENLLGGILNPGDERDDRQLARDTLAQINVGLRTHVLAPFSSEASTVNYSRQALDFWTHDTNPMAAQVQAPVLVIGSEYDKIVSPALARLVSSYFPCAKYAEVPGGTHYSFHDSPALVAGIIEDFFAEVNRTGKVRRHGANRYW